MNRWHKFDVEDSNTWPNEEGQYFVLTDYKGLAWLTGYGVFERVDEGTRIYFDAYNRDGCDTDEISFWCGPIEYPPMPKRTNLSELIQVSYAELKNKNTDAACRLFALLPDDLDEIYETAKWCEFMACVKDLYEMCVEINRKIKKV